MQASHYFCQHEQDLTAADKVKLLNYTTMVDTKSKTYRALHGRHTRTQLFWTAAIFAFVLPPLFPALPFPTLISRATGFEEEGQEAAISVEVENTFCRLLLVLVTRRPPPLPPLPPSPVDAAAAPWMPSLSSPSLSPSSSSSSSLDSDPDDEDNAVRGAKCRWPELVASKAK